MPPRKTPQTAKQGPPRATDAQLAQRISTVHGMLVQGKSRPAILAYAAEHWSLSTRQTDELTARARDLLTTGLNEENAYHLNVAIERMNAVFAEAFAAKDYQAAISAQRETSKLLGLYAPSKQDVNVSSPMTWAQMLAAARNEATANGGNVDDKETL